jgi:hypothetical protein
MCQKMCRHVMLTVKKRVLSMQRKFIIARLETKTKLECNYFRTQKLEGAPSLCLVIYPYGICLKKLLDE